MLGLFRPFFDGALLHGYRLLTDCQYRRHAFLSSRIGLMDRYTHCNISISSFQLSIPDNASFLSAYEEIFVKQIYKFNSIGTSPRILDIGANIGLSVLYFKQLYPEAVITAVEPDPSIFEHLVRNVHGNGFSDVRLINAAAWDKDTVLSFRSDGADGGRILAVDEDSSISVQALDSARLLREETYDFLKMDIEGSEAVVLTACKDGLSNIRHIFVEYHGRSGHPHELQQVLSVLTAAGFLLHIHTVSSADSPFIGVNTYNGFCHQLNIFGWRQ